MTEMKDLNEYIELQDVREKILTEQTFTTYEKNTSNHYQNKIQILSF